MFKRDLELGRLLKDQSRSNKTIIQHLHNLDETNKELLEELKSLNENFGELITAVRLTCQ